jgi:hypothetical protein
MNALAQGVVASLAEADERTSTLTGTAIDVVAYEGVAAIILNSGAASAGTTPTLDVKLQECDTSGGTYTDVSGATFTQVTDAAAVCEVIFVNVSDLQRYLKVIGTIAGAGATFDFGVEFLGIKKASS